ncbi:MAG TPA: helix-turn-helix domain-containing protein [Candidatus Acidoferrales bacterium]|nr:helix-turn-helix domain-containing protein [Candidatus Acidoferrales bacterium]
MDVEEEFTGRLIKFGLSEKEARLYLHLLKYGPKPPTLLAKSLKTYREDVHRMLVNLVEKGMVNPSLDSPTVYAAVELDIALDATLKKHESELREMAMIKRELEEISKQQRFRPSDEVCTFKIIKSIKELIAIGTSLVASLERELMYVIPGEMLIFATLYGLTGTKKLIKNGGQVRVITNISHSTIESAQQLSDIGEDVRHYNKYRGVYFGVWDRKICLNAINVGVRRISLDEPVAVLWTDDAAYAEYLISTFELLWKQSIPAAQRIKELLKEDPLHV